MIDWGKMFENTQIVRGRNLYMKDRVTEYEEKDGTVQAIVLGNQRQEVKIRINPGGSISMRCKCSVARSGKNCQHMAAVWFAAEAKSVAEKAAEAKAAQAAAEKELARQTAEAAKKHAVEQEQKRIARAERKAERAKAQEEQKKKTLEEQKKAAEQKLAEENRRRQIREQKAQDARKRAEKREREQREARTLSEKRAREKEEALQQELQRQREEEARLTALKQREAALAEEKAKRNMEYSLIGEAWDFDDEPNTLKGEIFNMNRLKHYSYFRPDEIKKSIKIAKNVYAAGEKLLNENKLEIKDMTRGYDSHNGENIGGIRAIGRENKEEFEVTAYFNKNMIMGVQCECSKCRYSFYYGWYTRQTDCAYQAGLIKYLTDFLSESNFGDATDFGGNQLLTAFKQRRASSIFEDNNVTKESLSLVPRLILKDEQLTISFRIGSGKLFVIKKLDEFCGHVKNSDNDIYGSNTEINHASSNFTERGREWIRFISRIVREEQAIQQRISETTGYYRREKVSVGGALNLFGWRIDELYQMLEKDKEIIEYEDRDSGQKRKDILSTAVRNPKISIEIGEDRTENRSEFHGILVNGKLPDLFYGSENAYYVTSGYLCRVERNFMSQIEPLTNLAQYGEFSFKVGRNRLSEFYYDVLPMLRTIAEVKESNPQKFRSYLVPEAHFYFYLDAEDHDVTCKAIARYGHEECNLMDLLINTKLLQPFRDTAIEGEVLSQVMQWLPNPDLTSGELTCGGDEEMIYHMMEEGTQKLLELGEVHATTRFHHFHVVRHVKVSVGVSVSSGLLDLDIQTDDVTPGELLDILASYHLKKKYHRLRDGSFVNMEDSSLELLTDLMKTANIKPKDFVKGKMHLPLYRTLYLDKMLEEHDNVYSDRDKHFKEVVKGFKIFQDSDFETPKNLSKIMRKYQKNGYKWLRTLASWNFGGILADDMGLGKTLQVISVLLAVKDEGDTGTSLVVAPASLIYNWEEEFSRFAPELKVSVIAGTQDSRREMIEDYKSQDVLVTSYDLLKRDIHFYEDKEFSYEIIDEAQYIKNHTTAAAKAVKVIQSRIRYALTGTPIENRLSELWSIFDYLMPGFLYGYDVFKRELEAPIVKNSDEATTKRLQKMVGPFILRRLKGDVLKDLPEKLEEYHFMRFDDNQQKLYDAQVIHMKETLARQNESEFNKNKIQILAELTRLRQICCDPSLCFSDYRGESSKLEACIELIQSAIDGGHRILLFSQFTSMLEIIQRRLEQEDISYYTITGATSKEKRLELVEDFNSDTVPVFLISLKAGGVGLNLTGADVVIHYDPWWNQAAQNQATDRAHRIGQTRKVTVYKMIVRNTIEEKIKKIQETKRDLADQVIGGETGQLGGLSKEELLELLEV